MIVLFELCFWITNLCNGFFALVDGLQFVVVSLFVLKGLCSSCT
jgi:hypothetical protein